MAAATPEERIIDESVEALEQRVHRLEQAVAAMSDTHLMEDRVVERVARRIEPHQNGGLFAGAARFLKGGARASETESSEATPETAPDAALPLPTPEAPTARPGWLILEFIQEIRTAVRMFADYRYRMSWTGRIVPLACILLVVLSWFLFSGIRIIGGVVDCTIDFVLVVILYKALSREVERYQSGAGRVLR